MKSFKFLGVKFDLTSRQDKNQGYVVYYFTPVDKIKLANKNSINYEMVITRIHFENAKGKFNWSIQYLPHAAGIFFGYINKDTVDDYLFNEDIDKAKELG